MDFVLGTAGHIDHGKTSLVQALTGVNTDRLPAEKARGITIDLGFAALKLGNQNLSIVDVPGHERFIRNMLAGAAGIELAMLVVAADDSVMPQTREHLEILKFLRIPKGLVVITKTDLVDSDWLALVSEEVRGLVAGSFLEDCPIVATSTVHRTGLDEIKDILGRMCAELPPKRETGAFRLSVDRSFALPGHGTIATGTVATGSVDVGANLELWPEGRTVRVRSIQQHGQSVERVEHGGRTALNLVGVHHTDLSRGAVLAQPGYLSPSTRLTVEIQPTANAVRPLRERTRYRLYLGTAEATARLVFLDPPKEPNTPRLAQLVIVEPVVAVFDQPFVLREESPPTTLGGGRVLQPSARRIRRTDLAGIQRLEKLRGEDKRARLLAVLEEFGRKPRSSLVLCRESGLPMSQIDDAIQALEAEGLLLALPTGPRRSRQLPRATVEELENRVLRTLKRLHQASPRLSAIPRPRLLSELKDIDEEGLIHAIMDRLASQKRVTVSKRTVAIRGYEPKLSQSERKLKAQIAQAFLGTGFSPPDRDDWLKQPGMKASTIHELFSLLCDEEQLADLGGGLYLEADVLPELLKRVRDRLSDGSSLSMAELRDLLGTTRKYAVPIGEYLDRVGLTVREGDVRRLKQTSEVAEPTV
jgi:selenocysteine-specific elongation factor